MEERVAPRDQIPRYVYDQFGLHLRSDEMRKWVTLKLSTKLRRAQDSKKLPLKFLQSTPGRVEREDLCEPVAHDGKPRRAPFGDAIQVSSALSTESNNGKDTTWFSSSFSSGSNNGDRDSDEDYIARPSKKRKIISKKSRRPKPRTRADKTTLSSQEVVHHDNDPPFVSSAVPTSCGDVIHEVSSTSPPPKSKNERLLPNLLPVTASSGHSRESLATRSLQDLVNGTRRQGQSEVNEVHIASEHASLPPSIDQSLAAKEVKQTQGQQLNVTPSVVISSQHSEGPTGACISPVPEQIVTGELHNALDLAQDPRKSSAGPSSSSKERQRLEEEENLAVPRQNGQSGQQYPIAAKLTQEKAPTSSQVSIDSHPASPQHQHEDRPAAQLVHKGLETQSRYSSIIQSQGEAVPQSLVTEVPAQCPPRIATPNAPKSPAQGISRGSSTSSLKLRFTIIKARTPRLSQRLWEGGALSNRTAESLFEEISGLIDRPSIRRIAFRLSTSQGDNEAVITRGDEIDFEAMREAFTEDIKSDMRKTKNSVFKIELEPDPYKGLDNADGSFIEDFDICI